MAVVDIRAAIAAHRERIERAHAALASATTEHERADALVDEAEARLAFEAVCERLAATRTDVIAARVAIGEWSVDEACAVIEGSGFERSSLARWLVDVVPVQQWIDAFSAVERHVHLALIQQCIARDDRDGALRVFDSVISRTQTFEWDEIHATLSILRAWGRPALRPWGDALRRFANTLSDDGLGYNDERFGTRIAAWALTQDDATLARRRVELLARLDALCESDPYTELGRFDPRVALVELFIATGELAAALRLFERIIEWPDADGDHREYRAFFAVHELLPSFARALVGEELARVESLIFQRWIEPASPSEQCAWLPVLRTSAREKTLALLEANATQPITVSLASLPPSVRAPQVRRLLDELRAHHEARAWVRTMDERGALYALLVHGHIERCVAPRTIADREAQALDLVLAFAREGHEEALSALEQWDAPGAIAKTFAWFVELPASTVRALIAQHRDTPARFNPYHKDLSLLAQASAPRRAQWVASLQRAHPSHAVHLGSLLARGPNTIDTALAEVAQVASSDRWPSATLVQFVRSASGAPRGFDPLLRRWLNAMERRPSDAPVDRNDLGAQLLCYATPAQLERAALLDAASTSASITHGILVGAVRAERELSVDLRSLRARVARAFDGADDEPWARWVRARFGAEDLAEGALDNAPLEELTQSPAMAAECAELGLVDAFVQESGRRDDDTQIQVCNKLLPLASEPCRERAIPLFFEALTSVEHPWIDDACVEHVPIDALCARWPRLGRVGHPLLFDAPLLRRLGGQDAIDRVGALVVARWVERG